MTSPPQPQRKTIVDDLDLGVTGNQVQTANPKRAAANQRQREQAAAEAEHQRWYAAFVEDLYGKQS
jgi:hypothetical protein